MNPYNNIAEIEAVVRGFEDCSTDAAAFSHRSHLTVAVSYLRKFKSDEAGKQLRAGLIRFLDHHGVGLEKYNETLTAFWLEAVGRVVDSMGEDPGLLKATNLVIETLGNSGLALDYYSPDRLWSEEARAGRIQPDLKTFDQLASSQISSSS